jgi:hypothetical protein
MGAVKPLGAHDAQPSEEQLAARLAEQVGRQRKRQKARVTSAYHSR